MYLPELELERGRHRRLKLPTLAILAAAGSRWPTPTLVTRMFAPSYSNLLSGAQARPRRAASLRSARGVLERARRLRLALGGIHPVHLVIFARDARQFLRRLAVGIVQRLAAAVAASDRRCRAATCPCCRSADAPPPLFNSSSPSSTGLGGSSPPSYQVSFTGGIEPRAGNS